MKRVIGLLALLVVILTVTPAAADFYVVGASGKAGTQINSVPYTINSSGLYCLARSLTHSSTTSNAITINASNVTLDLMGFCLTGPGKTSGSGNSGIRITETSGNVEIRNGSIQAFGHQGIYAAPVAIGVATGIRVIALRINDMGSAGFSGGGTGTVIMGCAFMRNGWGVSVYEGAMIKGNQFVSNGSPAIGGTKAIVTDNMFYANGSGLSVSDSLVTDNSAFNNTNQGIGCGNNCTITRNTSLGNGSEGITANTFCTITNNTTKGLTYGAGCTLMNNTVVP